jgi:riboflavin synthase
MFTGIVQGTARVHRLTDQPGLRRLELAFAPGFCQGLAIGASVACNGVCLTVVGIDGADRAAFDAMQQTLDITTLGQLAEGEHVHVERAASVGAEIGGHPLSGHIDGTAELLAVETPPHNHVMRLAVPPALRRYVFPKGYVALDGCSLTIARADREAGWIEVWLIPETLRVTTFGQRRPGARLNLEIDRSTQAIVDTVALLLDSQLDERIARQLAALRPSGATGA